LLLWPESLPGVWLLAQVLQQGLGVEAEWQTLRELILLIREEFFRKEDYQAKNPDCLPDILVAEYSLPVDRFDELIW